MAPQRHQQFAAVVSVSSDTWTQVIELWPRARWLPFGPVFFHHGIGRGPFHGWCWRVVPVLNGRPSPMIQEGCGWARTRDIAEARARLAVQRKAIDDANAQAVKTIEVRSS